MGKCISTTLIQLEFLKVEEGETYLVTIPTDSTAEDLAMTIRSELHKGGVTMTECYIDHLFEQKGE